MFRNLKSFLFSNQTTRQTVAKNTLWMASSQIGGRILRALIIIYAARVLGAAEWGIFSYAVSLAAFLTIFTDFGIGPILTRETSKAHHDPLARSKILSTAFFIKIVLLILGVILIVFIAPQITKIEMAKSLFPFVALIVIFDTLREFGFSLTRALERMEWEAALYTLTNVAIIVAGFIALKFSPNVASFTYAYTIGTAIGMGTTFWVLKNHFRNVFSHFDRKLVQPIISSAWPFALSAVLGGLMINTDLLIIGFFRTAEEVGFYSVAERLILLLYLLPGVLASSIFPTFSRLAHQDKEKMRSVLERAISITYAVAIPLALGGVFIASSLIRTVFGAEYLPATLSFQILLLTIMFNFPAVILTNAIFAHNRQKELVKFTLIGGLGNVIFDVLFIPVLGIAGSAFATLLAQGISNLYLWSIMKRIQYFAVAHRLKKVIVASLLMMITTAILSGIGVPLLLVLGLSILFYGGMLYYFKEPLLKEVKLILRPSA